jgi:hypothetical protein
MLLAPSQDEARFLPLRLSAALHETSRTGTRKSSGAYPHALPAPSFIPVGIHCDAG